LRSVVQHARVSFPCDPASDLSISGIPDAWDIIINLSPPIYTVSSCKDRVCQYQLAIAMRLLLLFSLKTAHANAISEIDSILEKKSALFRWTNRTMRWIWLF
jgi:hypothetical protein